MNDQKLNLKKKMNGMVGCFDGPWFELKLLFNLIVFKIV